MGADKDQIKDKVDDYLLSIFANPESGGGFQGPDKVWREVKADGNALGLT